MALDGPHARAFGRRPRERRQRAQGDLHHGRGVGMDRETAVLFAGKGRFVGAYDVNSDGLNDLEREIGGGNGIFATLDVTDPRAYSDAVAGFDVRAADLLPGAGSLRPRKDRSLDEAGRAPLESSAVRHGTGGRPVSTQASTATLRRGTFRSTCRSGR